MGVAFNALLDDQVVGSFEVDDDLTGAGSNLAFSGWVDECDHCQLAQGDTIALDDLRRDLAQRRAAR